MTSTTTASESNNYGAVASDYTSSTFPSLPTDIVRLIFEVSIIPGLRAGDEQQRQRTAYAFCLVSKNVKAWVEPLLYEKAVLESDEQVIRFLRTLEIKPATFLARAVKTVWILNEELPRDTSNQLSTLFSKCPLLERFTINDSPINIRILQNIFEPQSGPYVLQELTIINAHSYREIQCFLPNLALQKLHIINCSPYFLSAFTRRAMTDTVFLNTFRAIPQIYLDFTTIPSIYASTVIQCIVIPRWIIWSPESISVLHVRASSDTPALECYSFTGLLGAGRDEEELFSDVDSWIKYFDEDVQTCGGRLVVRTFSGAEVHSNPGASDIEQCTALIGLN